MKSTTGKVFILAFVMVVVTLGFGLVMPIIPYYMESLGAGGTELGLLVASYAIMRLIFGPIWGRLSDRWGRKPVLIIGVFGYAITMILFGLADKLWMLFAARILSGILSSATSPTTMAYISDSTPEEKRSGGMGTLGAAMGIGIIIGPAIGGWLANITLSTPFFAAAGFAVISMVMIILFLPESLPMDKRIYEQKNISLFPIKETQNAFRSPLGKLFIMLMCVSLIGATFYGIFGLYALDKFNFGPDKVGLILMVVGIISSVAQGGFTGILTRWFGEERLIRFSFLGTGLSLLLMPFSNEVFFFLIIGLFSLFTALLTPVLTSAISKQNLYEHGLRLGISNSFVSLGRIIGPGTAGFFYDQWIELPYLICFAVAMLGLALPLIKKKSISSVE